VGETTRTQGNDTVHNVSAHGRTAKGERCIFYSGWDLVVLSVVRK
jgi:hypothetical protein